MKIFKLEGISRKYALQAAHFRRTARASQLTGLDYSEKALRNLYEWESYGIGKVDKSKNGYAYGKWLIDLSVSMWIEDIIAGNACKAEFLTTSIERIHNTNKLKCVPAGALFGYSKELYDKRPYDSVNYCLTCLPTMV